MTVTKLNTELAKAIGWEKVYPSGLVNGAVQVQLDNGWYRTFDYRDDAVIGPIAAKYGVTVDQGSNGYFTYVKLRKGRFILNEVYVGVTPQWAAANAVVRLLQFSKA